MAHDQNWFDKLMNAGESLLLDLMEEAYDRVGDVDGYGSQIEHSFAVAACALLRTRYPEFAYLPIHKNESDEELKEIAHNLRNPPAEHTAFWGCLFPQVKIGEHRVDFLLLHTKGLEGFGGIVVECDGHEFHEKTKDQASRDKARDRDLQEAGYKVLRFSGADIWRDAFKCADEVLQMAHGLSVDSEYARTCLRFGDVKDAVNALKWVM